MFNKPKSKPADLPMVPMEQVEDLSSETPRGLFAKITQPSNPSAGVLDSSHKPAVISEEFVIRGDIESEGTLHVEGKIIGTVLATAVNVSKTGYVEGDIICQSLNLKGHIQGNVSCDEVSLSETAHITGTLKYRFISVGKGAQITCEMTLAD